MRDWKENRRQLIHRLNGQLLVALRKQLAQEIQWKPEHWIVNVIVLHRIIEDKEEAFLKTSATMLNGTVYDQEPLDPEAGIGDFDRVVPLMKSLSGYCIRTGNVVWVDNLQDLRKDQMHPLYHDYRPFEYVSVIPESQPLAEYVFPIRIQIGLSEAILGVVNAECTKIDNQFKEKGFHKVLDAVLNLLDVHGPFLVVAEHVEVNDRVKKSLESAHRIALKATMLSRGKNPEPAENR